MLYPLADQLIYAVTQLATSEFPFIIIVRLQRSLCVPPPTLYTALGKAVLVGGSARQSRYAKTPEPPSKRSCFCLKTRIEHII